MDSIALDSDNYTREPPARIDEAAGSYNAGKQRSSSMTNSSTLPLSGIGRFLFFFFFFYDEADCVSAKIRIWSTSSTGRYTFVLAAVEWSFHESSCSRQRNKLKKLNSVQHRIAWERSRDRQLAHAYTYTYMRACELFCNGCSICGRTERSGAERTGPDAKRSLSVPDTSAKLLPAKTVSVNKPPRIHRGSKEEAPSPVQALFVPASLWIFV